MLTGEYAFRKSGTGVLTGDAALIIEPEERLFLQCSKKQAIEPQSSANGICGLGDKTKPIDWNGEIIPGPCELGFDYSFIMAATGDRAPCVYVKNHSVVGLVADDPISVNYKEAYPGDRQEADHRESLKMDWSEDTTSRWLTESDGSAT
jgi:hypothetical protein